MSLLELKSNFCKLDADHRLYGLEVPIIGLTGGIATGKSTASTILKQKKVPLLDADALVKDIYGMESTVQLVKRLAPLAVEGAKIDFKVLRKAFFEDANIKKGLESHIYAHLEEAFLARFSELNDPGFVVYDVPLLFEKKLQVKMDLTLLVYAPREIQLDRLMKRDKIAQSLAENIISNQMPIDEKKSLADFTLENTSDIGHLESEIEQFLRATTNFL